MNGRRVKAEVKSVVVRVPPIGTNSITKGDPVIAGFPSECPSAFMMAKGSPPAMAICDPKVCCNP